MNTKEHNNYTRPKTVRFDPATWRRIVIAARAESITTSAYIRDLVVDRVTPLVRET